MRCMACGAEMRLLQVVRDNRLMLSGYEHHRLQCASCGETEQRFVFSRESVHVEPVPIPTSRLSMMPPAPGVWARAVAKLRGWQIG
jgi:hypothetical protein